MARDNLFFFFSPFVRYVLSELATDVIVTVGEVKFNLHKVISA